MKKLLCIFSSVAIITSTVSSAYFGVNLNNFNENQKQDKIDISTQLTNYFESASNNHSNSNITRNISTFDDTFVLNYIEFENNFLFINFERLRENIDVSDELISILEQDEFSHQLNDAFQLGLFEYTGSAVVYVPYEEEKTISCHLNFNEIQNGSLLRNLSQRIGGRIFTRWFWFGTFEVQLNNASTQNLINILNNVIVGMDLTVRILDFLSIVLRGVGQLITGIIAIVLSILSLYLSSVSPRIENINNGNGIFFRVTIIIVHSMRAL